jgi:transcriptional regulator with XRE-family HTH domain
LDKFCKRLKQAMQLRKMSQTDICEKTGIPKSAMSQYVSGAFEPKQERTFLLANALNINEAWLMGYDDVPMERKSTPIIQDRSAVIDRINALSDSQFDKLEGYLDGLLEE